MKAAERLFLEKGLEQTTIEDITRGADVAKGTFYLHFSSKADVVEALRARFVQQALDEIIAAVARQNEKDWRGKLAAWSRACATGYFDAASLHHLVFVAAPPASQEGLTRNILIDDLAALLAAGVAENAWSIDDPTFTAIFLFNALHGVVNQPDAAGQYRRDTLQSIEEHFLRFVERGDAASQ